MALLCSACNAALGSHYFSDVPGVDGAAQKVLQLCVPCHKVRFPGHPRYQPPAASEVTFTLYECAVCYQIVRVPSDTIVACGGKKGTPHPLAALRPQIA